MPETKASILRFYLALALRKVRLAHRRLGLSEEERRQVADDTISELRRYGQFPDLDQELPIQHPGERWRDGKPPGA